MEYVTAQLAHTGVRTVTSVNPVLKTTSVDSSPLSAQSALSSQYLSPTLLSALLVLKDTPGKDTPVLNVQKTTSGMELLAVFVRKEPHRPKIKPSAKSLVLTFCQW